MSVDTYLLALLVEWASWAGNNTSPLSKATFSGEPFGVMAQYVTSTQATVCQSFVLWSTWALF